MLPVDSQIGLVCARRIMFFLWHVRDEDPNDRKGKIALVGKLLPAQAILCERRPNSTAVPNCRKEVEKLRQAKY